MLKLFKRSFLFNLFIVFLLCIFIFAGFFLSLYAITRKGHELKVPQVTGGKLLKVTEQLRTLKFKVYVDSTYEPAYPPLAVLKQVPDPGAIVKEGRTIFLTVNRVNPPLISMPNLVGMSFASARRQLQNNRLLLGDTLYKPSNAQGSVLEQWYDGSKVWVGKKIHQGSKITLVLGSTREATEFDMPDVTGRSLDIALTILDQYHLSVEVISQSNAMTLDTAETYVLEQDPADANEEGVFNKVKPGAKVKLVVP